MSAHHFDEQVGAGIAADNAWAVLAAALIERATGRPLDAGAAYTAATDRDAWRQHTPAGLTVWARDRAAVLIPDDDVIPDDLPDLFDVDLDR